MSALDLTWIRAQFPALAQEMNGTPVVFFDGPRWNTGSSASDRCNG